MNKSVLVKKFGILFMAALFLVSLFSCSKSQRVSFTSLMDEVDVYIQAGSYTDALNMLGKAEKNASGILEKVAVYKRYSLMGEKDRCEKWLLKCIKKNPDCQEFNALYVNFLLKEERWNEAWKKSESLTGTQYESLRTESFLRYVQKNNLSAREAFDGPLSKKEKKHNPVTQKERDEVFMDLRFIEYYVQCYKATSLNYWLENAATLYMRNGSFVTAQSLYPDSITNVQESFFWACVLYDGGNYAKALECLLSVKDKWAYDVYSVRCMALACDCLYILGEEDSCDVLRQEILLNAENGLYGQEEIIEIQNVMQGAFLNSYLFYRAKNEIAEEYQVIETFLSFFPDYEKALACLAEFAIDTMNRPVEEELLSLLRTKGLRTQGMEKSDALPKVQLSESLAAVEESLLKEDLTLANRMDLVVLREKLYWESNKDLTRGEKFGRLYLLLEKYPAQEQIIKFAVEYFVQNEEDEKAREMFNIYLVQKYGIALDDVVEKCCVDKKLKLELWEYEASAWFMRNNNYDSMRKIYEYVVKAYEDRNPGILKGSGNAAFVSVLVNYAELNSMMGNNVACLEFLNIASGKCMDPMVKAEILYRIAQKESAKGEFRDALRTLRYCLTLDENHNKARLLIKQIEKKLDE